MPIAPSRLKRAKKVLLKVYAKTGGMPSVVTFAKEMGYSSPGSAFELTEALFTEGFLAKGPTGRLLPGPKFLPSRELVPPEMLAILPPGGDFKVLRAPDASLAEVGILEGDSLVVGQGLEPQQGHLVLSQGQALTIADEPKPGWIVEGHLVAQFRSYL